MSSEHGIMNADEAIRVEGVGKKYRLQAAATRTLKGSVLELLSRRGRRRDFWALREVSFAVRRGESLGIIGVNGAGKSTLLSLLAGTKTPTTGRIETRGTVASLLELGAGFHPDLTGRENVFLCGAIMGVSRRQMLERFDAVVEFAEISEFIDEPVKHYSSGMYVRLGFAVAVEVDPDVLLIDEVLAVGDVNFQKKCTDKMNAFRKQGKTMLTISHDLPTVQAISDRILLLDRGRVLGIGDPQNILHRYESLSRDRTAESLRREWGTGEVRIGDVTLTDAQGRPASRFGSDGQISVEVRYRASRRVPRPVFGFAVSNEAGELLHGSNTQLAGFPIESIEGEGAIRLHLEDLRLAPGTYLFSFSVHSEDHKINYHRVDNAYPFAVESDRTFDGFMFIPSRWSRP